MPWTNHTFFLEPQVPRDAAAIIRKQAIHVCEFDFGPLEAAYDYDAIKDVLTREAIESRPQTMWRYRELLPIDGEPTVGDAGRVHAAGQGATAGEGTRHSRALHQERYRSIIRPSRFKDRVVSVALSRARELGFKVVACASTGNLANSVAANAAAPA